MENNKVDYKKMYHIMVNAAEDAMRILIEAQQKCEEMYIESSDEETALPPDAETR